MPYVLYPGESRTDGRPLVFLGIHEPLRLSDEEINPHKWTKVGKRGGGAFGRCSANNVRRSPDVRSRIYDLIRGNGADDLGRPLILPDACISKAESAASRTAFLSKGYRDFLEHGNRSIRIAAKKYRQSGAEIIV